MQRSSYKRRCLRTMREVFLSLNDVPHEIRKDWGNSMNYLSYNFAIKIIDKELEKLDKALARMKRVKA